MDELNIFPFPLAALLPHLQPTGDFNGGDPHSRLSCSLDLGQGKHAHLHLIQVLHDDRLDAANGDLADDLDFIARLSGCLRDDLSTVDIAGRSYVLMVTPFAF